MRLLYVSQSGFEEGITRLRESYRIYGPKPDGRHLRLEALSAGAMPDMTAPNTLLSAKGVVYPQSEKMFHANLNPSGEDHHVYREAQKDYSPRAVFGIRPCDARAFTLVRPNFDNKEYRDPWWVRGYEACTFVGHACVEPRTTCFCTSTGGGPFDTTGLDVLLSDTDGGYLAQVLTEKGEALANAAGWLGPEVDESEKELAACETAAAAKIVSSIQTQNLPGKTILSLYDAPFWEDAAFACINCGTCTYLCPTCWCFDIQDEEEGAECVRMKNWDSCMFPLFTLHGSGHNPRPNKTARVRQRFMHKLKYYTDKYGKGIHCTGCGRCVTNCPVNIDIRRIASLMNDYEPGNACAL
jgi:sulfhydrogenase subunit beta (sulfur reductase)